MAGGGRKTLAPPVLLVLLALAFVGGRASATPPSPIRAASIPLEACIARIAPGDTTAAIVAASLHPDAAMAARPRFDCAKPQGSFGSGNFWVRLTPRQPNPVGLDIFSFQPVWQTDASLTAVHADGSEASVRLDNRTVSTFAHLGPRENIPVPGDSSPVKLLLMRIDGTVNNSGLVLSPRLIDDTENERSDRIETAIYAFFAGLCAALLVYNGVLWLAIRERFQITYCLTVLAMLACAWSRSAALLLSFPQADVTWAFRLTYPTLALTSALGRRFIIEFLEADAVPVWLRRLVGMHNLCLTGAALAVSCAPAGWAYPLDRLFVALLALAPVLTVSIVIAAFRRSSRAIRMVVLAWATPLAIVVLRLINTFHLAEYSQFDAHAPLLSMALEVLISALAIALRVKRIAEERDMAHAREQVARHLADIDPLTGLLNRRALLANTLAWQSPEPLRLMIVDVDHFKTVNDIHGHDLGDAVLCELAALLAERTALRASIGRLGGEEFALIGTADELTAPLALAILADVRAHVFSNGIRVTVSIGMAEGMVTDEASWLALYRRADTALYAAKDSGRNRAIDLGTQVGGTQTGGTQAQEVIRAEANPADSRHAAISRDSESQTIGSSPSSLVR